MFSHSILLPLISVVAFAAILTRSQAPLEILPLQPGQTQGVGFQWNVQAYLGSPVAWGSWGLWSTCQGTCGIGNERRQRSCFSSRTLPAGQQSPEQAVPLTPSGSTLPGIRQGQATFVEQGCFGFLIQARGCRLLPCVPRYGIWTSWATCSVPCGGGTQSRSRLCETGSTCAPENLVETRQCNTPICQVTPVWGNWTPFSACTVSCGGGTQSRSRPCSSGNCPTIGGVQVRQCNTQTCIVVDPWGPWRDWSSCSTTCGGGTQTRSRQCVSGSCPSVGATITRPCNVDPCFVPAVWGTWNAYGDCSVTCGGGTQSRFRPCASGNCPLIGATESRTCNTPSCAAAGFWSQWSSYSPCTVSCGGGGTQSRTRVCIGSSTCTGEGLQQRACGAGRCIGTWRPWGPYSLCTRECGGGTRVRTRSCSEPGTCSGERVQSEQCNQQPCRNYTWGLWGPFSQCSATCGQGTYTKSRTCLLNNVPTDNSECEKQGGSSQETQFCFGPTCFSWSQWSAASCSVTCGSGVSTRVRRCVSSDGTPATTTASCPDPSNVGSSTTATCTLVPCLTWDNWGPWGACPVQCGLGRTVRLRSCLSNGQIVQASMCSSIPGDASEDRICNGGPCYTFGEWGPWDPCSATCGPGSSSRRRSCLSDGQPITLSPNQRCGSLIGNLFETRNCFQQPCYKLRLWSDWTPCSVTCGQGVINRVRYCDDESNNKRASGDRCGISDRDLTQSQSCLLRPCYNWGPWSTASCSVTCGTGVATRRRRCVSSDGQQAASMNMCPDPTKYGDTISEPCTLADCCGVGPWTSWSSCSATCGQGSEGRSRSCICNGRPVASLRCGIIPVDYSQRRGCNQGCCYTWGPWSAASCSVTCGTGVSTRFRRCLCNGNVAPRNTMCPGPAGSDVLTGPCTQEPCCAVGAWTPWSSCSATCGPGSESRTRTCTCGGRPVISQRCGQIGGGYSDTRPCARQCYQWTQWSQWSSCSAACGPGGSTRSRRCVDIVTNRDAPRVTDCADPLRLGVSQNQNCNLGPCCSWAAWTSYSSCPVTCGTGQIVRTRRCVTTSGADAGNLCECPIGLGGVGGVDSRPCDEGPCCAVGPWSPWGSCSVTCGQGFEGRTRTCICGGRPVISQRCGTISGGYSDSRTCTRQCYQLTQWTQWSACSATCGSGQIVRTRRCVDSITNRDAPKITDCGRSATGFETQTCNVGPCCAVGPWTSWSSCSVTCGQGSESRSRTCTCNGRPVTSQRCGTIRGGYSDARPCTRQCYNWSAWSTASCSVTCGAGVATRTRRCLSNDGTSVPNRNLCNSATGTGHTTTEPCILAPCCGVGPWTSWSSCSASCGPGSESRTRTCTCNGRSVASQRCGTIRGGYSEARSCTRTRRCYTIGPWGPWSRCTSSCGQGTITRTRSCQASDGSPAPSGACGSTDLVLRGTCTRPSCPGTYGAWSQWTACSLPCNSGTRERTRVCPSSNCPGVSMEKEICNRQPCGTPPTQGEWSVWSAWSQCTNPCGGTRSKRRTCVGGNKPSDCGTGDFIRTVTCTNCPSGGSFGATSCRVPPAVRRRCQPDTASPAVCIAQGCCYDNTTPGAPMCFFQLSNPSG